MLTINPTNVIKFGANHIGVFDTSQHHQGFNIGSNRLQLVIEYLCSVNLFSCAGTNSLFLYENMLFKFTIITSFYSDSVSICNIIFVFYLFIYIQRKSKMKERKITQQTRQIKLQTDFNFKTIVGFLFLFIIFL